MNGEYNWSVFIVSVPVNVHCVRAIGDVLFNLDPCREVGRQGQKYDGYGKGSCFRFLFINHIFRGGFPRSVHGEMPHFSLIMYINTLP